MKWQKIMKCNRNNEWRIRIIIIRKNNNVSENIIIIIIA